jgi:hypothetical protein
LQALPGDRDFRLLAGLADAVGPDRRPSIVLPDGPVFSSQDEAVDSSSSGIAEARKRAKTLIDQRALDLLSARRAAGAELKNQPGRMPTGLSLAGGLSSGRGRLASPA